MMEILPQSRKNESNHLTAIEENLGKVELWNVYSNYVSHESLPRTTMQRMKNSDFE